MKRRLPILGLLLIATGAVGAAAPEQKCEATKNKLAGTYAACRQAAEAKAILKETEPDFAKCEARLGSGWLRAEAKAAAKGAACPTEGDLAEVQASIDELTASLAATLSGDCPGELVGGFCWFLGAAGQSCEATCAAASRVYDDAGTRGYAGSDGTNEQCVAVMNAIGGSEAKTAVPVGCANALGCNATVAGVLARCTPPTTAAALEGGQLRACACALGVL